MLNPGCACRRTAPNGCARRVLRAGMVAVGPKCVAFARATPSASRARLGTSGNSMRTGHGTMGFGIRETQRPGGAGAATNPSSTWPLVKRLAPRTASAGRDSAPSLRLDKQPRQPLFTTSTQMMRALPRWGQAATRPIRRHRAVRHGDRLASDLPATTDRSAFTDRKGNSHGRYGPIRPLGRTPALRAICRRLRRDAAVRGVGRRRSRHVP